MDDERSDDPIATETDHFEWFSTSEPERYIPVREWGFKVKLPDDRCPRP